MSNKKQGDNKMQIKEAIEKFNTQLVGDAKSKHTISSYLRDVRMLVEWLPDGDATKLQAITPQMLNEFITSRFITHKPDGEPRKKTSINKIKCSIKAFFTWTTEMDFIPDNPSRCLKIRLIHRQIPDMLDGNEIDKLYRTIESEPACYETARDRIMFELFLSTGLRLSELVSLDVEDIDLETGKFILRNGKREVQSVKFIKQELLARIRDYLQVRSDVFFTESGALFLSNQRHRISTRQVQFRFEQWKNICRFTKNVTIHSLRHTFASNLYSKTKNILLVQRALDHKNLSTSQLYAHLNDSELQQAVELI